MSRLWAAGPVTQSQVPTNSSADKGLWRCSPTALIVPFKAYWRQKPKDELRAGLQGPLICIEAVRMQTEQGLKYLKSSVPAISKAPSDSLELYSTRQQCLLHAEIIPSHGRLELHPRDEAYFFSSSLSPRICYTSTSSTSTSFTVKAPVYSKYKPNHQTTFQQLLEAQCRNYEFNPMELNTSTQSRKTRISAQKDAL